jgi:uncharacterized coiled-coil DUF342 family protein
MESELLEDIRNRIREAFPRNVFSNGQRIDVEKFLATEWAQWKVAYDDAQAEMHETKQQADNLRIAYDELGRKHQQLKERCEKMEAALRGLVKIKDRKDKEGNFIGYATLKQAAWEDARKALSHKPEGINETEGEA